MAQKTFVDGDVLTASDINTYLSGEGGAWTGYTSTISQPGAITKTTNYSNYARAGRMITWNFSYSVTSAGTGGNNVTLTVPVTASSANALAGGAGQVYDLSTTTNYAGTWVGLSTTTIGLSSDGSVGGQSWGNTPNIALASGDVIRGSITYEAAS